MKKEWMKPSIIDFANSSINSGTDETGTPETVIMCVGGRELTSRQEGTGKSSRTFETCS